MPYNIKGLSKKPNRSVKIQKKAMINSFQNMILRSDNMAGQLNFHNFHLWIDFRISMTLACPMNLKLYPMDRQTCYLRIASCECVKNSKFMNLSWVFLSNLPSQISDGYTTDDITYRWKERDPVQIAKALNLPRFNVEKYSSSYCNVKTNTGKTWVEKKSQMEMKLDLLELKGKSERNFRGWKIDEHRPADSLKKKDYGLF